MTRSFLTTRRVEFRDTDAAGIAHFTAFFAYMEEAEHALLRSLGTSVLMRDEAGVISWPRVAASCDFTAPVRFEDELTVGVHVARLGAKSVTYGFDFSLGGREVAAGSLTAVCCRIAPGEPPSSISIPAPLAERLREFSREYSQPDAASGN